MLKNNGMTKNKLIKALQAMPGNPLIVLSRDAEGNGFSPLAAAEMTGYIPAPVYGGEIWEPEYDNQAEPEGVVSAVCLWPLH